MAQLVGLHGSPEPFPLRCDFGRSIPSREIEVFAAEYDNNLCLMCGYCLKHLPEKHICPECGTHYDLDHVVAEWQTYLSSRRKNR